MKIMLIKTFFNDFQTKSMRQSESISDCLIVSKP